MFKISFVLMASSFFGIFHGLNIFEQKDHSCSDQINLNYGYLNENRSFLLIINRKNFRPSPTKDLWNFLCKH